MKLYSEKENCYKLYHGSMLDMTEAIELNSIDSIVTDPPYELNFMNKGWDSSGIAFQSDTWKKCFDVLKPGGYLLAFGGSRTFHRIACAIEDAGFEIRDTIMWLYGSGFPKSMNIGLAIDKKNGVESKVVGIKEHCKKDFKENNLYAQDEANKNNTKCFGYGTEIVKEAQNDWKGWGTALKPSYEPIMVARKPFDGSLIDNVLANGVGGINIDECRVETGDIIAKNIAYKEEKQSDGWGTKKCITEPSNIGRFPANTILTYDESTYDEVCGNMPYTKNSGAPLTMPDLRDVGRKSKEAIGVDKLSFGQVRNAKRKPYVYAGREYDNKDTSMFNGDKPQAPSNYNDEGSASRYFKNCEYDDNDLEDVRRYYYCPKASKQDREEGCDELSDGIFRRMRPDKDDDNLTGLNKETRWAPQVRKNTHPTVKPTELMRYLIRLVAPKGATILDPFNGSGSTGKACMLENRERNKGYKYIGIDLSEEYLNISKARIEWAMDTEITSISNNPDDDCGEVAETPKVIKKNKLW